MIAYSNPVLVIARLCIFAIAILMIISLGSIIPEMEIPLLTKWGRNSLVIFLLHRYFTLIFVKILPIEQFNQVNIIYAVIASFFTLLLLGQDFISLKLSSFFDNITNTIFNDGIYNTNHHYFKETITIIGIIILLIQPIKSLSQYLSNQTKTNKIHTVMSIEQKNSLQDTIKIAFIGDMILLQDQVKKAYHENTGEYDFDSMFKYAMPYLSEADLAIGVFEGPTAGQANGYSKGNYDDGALVKLSEKMKGQMVDEFTRMLQEIRIGVSRKDALRALAERCNVQDVSLFTSALIQADQLGVSIAKVLRIQSVDMREKRKQRAEEQGMKAPIKMLFPLVFFIFPALLIVLLGPAVLQIFSIFANK